VKKENSVTQQSEKKAIKKKNVSVPSKFQWCQQKQATLFSKVVCHEKTTITKKTEYLGCVCLSKALKFCFTEIPLS